MFFNKLEKEENTGQISFSSLLNTVTNQHHSRKPNIDSFVLERILGSSSEQAAWWCPALHMHSDSAMDLSIQGHLPNICHDDIILLEKPIESTLCIDCNFSPPLVSYLWKIIQLDTLSSPSQCPELLFVCVFHSIP